jgi:hypothetical protein
VYLVLSPQQVEAAEAEVLQVPQAMADQAAAAGTRMCQELPLMAKDFQVAHLQDQV